MAAETLPQERPREEPPIGGWAGHGSVETLEAMLDALPAQVALLDAEGVVVVGNRCWREHAEHDEHSTAAAPGVNYLQFLEQMEEPCGENARAVAAAIRRVTQGETAEFCLEYRKPGGAMERWVRVTVAPSQVAGQTVAVVRQMEITAERFAAAKVERLNRLYAVCSGINSAIVRIADAQALYQEACRIAVEEGRLMMAWVGLHQEAHAQLVPTARWGLDEGYLESLHISTSAEVPAGRGPAGAAFRTGLPATCSDIADSTTFASRGSALARGYRSCAAFPLRVGGRSIGVFVVYSDVVDCFDTNELGLLEALTQNLSLAIEARQDLEKRREAEMSLRTSEERFRLLSKATNDAMWDWDVQSNLLWWSEGFEGLFGYLRAAVEPTLDSWTNRIHPEDVARVVANFHRTAVGAESMFFDEYRFRRKDGNYAYVLDRGHVMRDAEGRALRMVGGMTDLTDRMHAEERIAEQAALLDETRDAIVVRDLEHRVTFWNKGAERLYGWTTAEAVGKVFNDLVKAQAVKFDEANACVHAAGEWQGELRKTDKGGRKRVLDCRWTLLRGKDGQPRSILSIATDITEKKKIEMQFLRAQRMESIGTLAGGIAHDLNNILAPILMSIEWLRMHFKDAEADRMLEVIASSAERGAQMVQQVLSFARGVGGERIPIQPKHLLGDLQRFVYDTFPRDIEGRFLVEGDLAVILGDPTQIYQILLNLCVNARDAMPGGGLLKVRAVNQCVDAQFAAMELEARAGQYVLFEVEDEGTGIAPEDLEKIFDPFFTTKALGKGTGLGLSTTQGIVKSHRGFIRVNSEPGHGARFQIYLPAETDAKPVAAAVRAETKLPRGDGELILIVDDEANVREITQMTLQGFGYRTLTAENGVHALALVAMHAGEIAVVLTDMMMPVMDGPALIAALQKMAPNLPVIAASGVGSEPTQERAMEAGAKYFLPKPYTAETLLRMLAGMVG